MRVWFDPSVISYQRLLEVFFEEHNPTCKSKTQYKSGVWYHTPEQQEILSAVIADLSAKSRSPIVTTVDPVGVWYDAEEYHQKYIEKASSYRRGW